MIGLCARRSFGLGCELGEELEKGGGGRGIEVVNEVNSRGRKRAG